ncbi:MAG: DUF1501 domain-containing protein [Isosphaeraceae bacterium]|nr:DUF1501 domain-containing protein [Isosphaeraceae bacterium]
MDPMPTIDRRRWLAATACGFGSLAFQALARGESGPESARLPGEPKAKRVIFLFMQGGPSQHDLFDPKDFINARHGKPIDSPLRKDLLQVGTEKFLALGTSVPVRPRGASGIPMSDLLPNLARVADRICLLRGMSADNPQHMPAELQLHTGALNDVRPSMGAWISYGLGTENRDLPGFVTINPHADVRYHGSAWLPAKHQGMRLTAPLDEKTPPIEDLRDPSRSPAAQRERLAFMRRANRRLLDRVESDPAMQGMIDSMELAFRMQTTTPALVDLSRESKETLELYGVGAGETDRNARACLLARKLSESGVRFVQVTMGGWDHHGDIRGNLPRLCRQTDRPVAALIEDLARRGLLDDTLVVWSGEFGRTPWSQDLSGTAPIDVHGREHQPESFAAFLAGGGVKPGITHGETDELGYRVIAGRVHLHDLHASMLHLLGLDHTKLTWNHLGRDFRLTDVHGTVVREILA